MGSPLRPIPNLWASGAHRGSCTGQKRLGFRAFLALVLTPALILLAAAFVYTLATFLIFTPLSGMGEPVIKAGRFFFSDHGVIG